MSCNVDPNWLDAYADESCTPEEREGIETHLRACNACAMEALNRVQAKRVIRAAANRYAPSAEFQRRVEASVRGEQPGVKRGWRTVPLGRTLAWLPQWAAVAGAMLLVVASAVFWTGHVRQEQALGQLVDLHVATTASSNPVDVISTDRHTVKPWFQGKLPYAFNLPELQGTPFKLIGGKLAYAQHTAGAQLLFELRKHQISVFIFQNQFQDQPGMHLPAGSIRAKGFSTESWSEGGLHYTIIGDAAAGDLHQLSDLIRAAAR
jgi:anti-sigma factor RsiW